MTDHVLLARADSVARAVLFPIALLILLAFCSWNMLLRRLDLTPRDLVDLVVAVRGGDPDRD